jgi:hypothetical protein
MRYAKYSGAVICGILAIGTLPSIYFIGIGLTLGPDPGGERLWFSAKLAIYTAWVVALGYASYKLWRSAKASKP